MMAYTLVLLHRPWCTMKEFYLRSGDQTVCLSPVCLLARYLSVEVKRSISSVHIIQGQHGLGGPEILWVMSKLESGQKRKKIPGDENMSEVKRIGSSGTYSGKSSEPEHFIQIKVSEHLFCLWWNHSSQVVLVGESACQCRICKRCSLVPGSGKSSGVGNGNSLQYYCQENPTDREAWRATVHGVTKSQT